MIEWRKLRQEHPELFSQLRVWQQPAAVVDQIIWRWQCELEAAEYQQALRCTDTQCSLEQAVQGGHLADAADGLPSPRRLHCYLPAY